MTVTSSRLSCLRKRRDREHAENNRERKKNSTQRDQPMKSPNVGHAWYIGGYSRNNRTIMQLGNKVSVPVG